MDAIERDNPSLKGVLPKQYARPSLDKQRLGGLIDLRARSLLSSTAGGSATFPFTGRSRTQPRGAWR